MIPTQRVMSEVQNYNMLGPQNIQTNMLLLF